MSEVLTKVVIDCETGIQSTIPLTNEEIAEREAQIAAFAEAEAEREAEAEALEALKASARTKLIAGQPLTEEEAATIVL